MNAAALVLAAVALAPGTDQSFESMTTLPADWKLVEYVSGVSSATIETGDAAKGKHFLRLSAPKENHTRVFIPAKVEPNSTYRFSARIRATGGQLAPAVLSLDGSNITSDPIQADGRWHASRLYVRTGSADQVTLVLSYGRFGETVAGDADFDLLKLARIDAPPAVGAIADAPGAAPAPAAVAPAGAAAPAVPTVSQGPSKYVLPLSLVLLGLLIYSGRVLVRGDR